MGRAGGYAGGHRQGSPLTRGGPDLSGRSDGPERPATRLLHVGQAPAHLPRTVGPPIQKGSTVLVPEARALYGDGEVTYGRAGLAPHWALMDAMAELENATAVRLFPSGLAAVIAAILAVVRSGDEVLLTDAVYKPTRRFADRVLRRFGVSARYHPAHATPQDILEMCAPSTRLIVLESPGSLTLEMQDVPGIAAAAKARGVLTLIDNTWAAGLFFKPLDHGVDLSVQALTKYVGGHSDVFMGSVAARDPEMIRALDETVLDFGWAVSPDDAYMMLRGLRTLPTRLARHQDNALRVARWLCDRDRVRQVLYPPLPGSADHDLWARDYSGAAGLFSFVLNPVEAGQTRAFLDRLKLFGLGFSWGGFESLALNCDPQFAGRQWRPDLGGPTVRLSIGLEDPDDLIADLDQALAAIS